MYRKQQLSLAFMALLSAAPAMAQHPIDVQRDAAAGDYMAALVTYDKMPKRISTTQARIAAAKSAWALSLPDRALEEYDGAIRQGGLATIDLARIFLGKGIIEHQEGRHQLAILHLEKALPLLPEPSPLRAQVLSLWGESLAAMKQTAPAEEKYIQALTETDPESKPEMYFLLAQVQLELGKYEDARGNYEKIPLRHDRAPEAVRRLAEIGVHQGNFEAASLWLEKGRTSFEDAFLDSWTDYVLVRGALSKGDKELVKNLKSQADKRYPPSDPWLALLNAAVEEFVWKEGGGKR